MIACLDNAFNISCLREMAKRRLPRAVFDYLDGGAEDEITLKSNEAAFDNIRFDTRVLRNISSPQTSIDILSSQSSMPMVIGPTGFSGIMWPKAELCIAKAAADIGVPYCLSTFSCTAMEEVREGSDVDLWFQVYILGQRKITLNLIERAQSIGIETLVITVDNPTSGRRERDLKNGFVYPFRYTPGFIYDVLTHPGWLKQVALNGVPTFPNLQFEKIDSDSSMASKMASLIDGAVSWEDISRIRDSWKGRLIIKGILSIEDTILAKQAGVDAVVLSNHGGRQLDNAIESINLVNSVRATVGNESSIFIDGGVRRGRHIAAAMIRGANAVFVGRAVLYGVAAAGYAGARHALQILYDEYSRTLIMLGAASSLELSQRCSSIGKDTENIELNLVLNN